MALSEKGRYIEHFRRAAGYTNRDDWATALDVNKNTAYLWENEPGGIPNAQHLLDAIELLVEKGAIKTYAQGQHYWRSAARDPIIELPALKELFSEEDLVEPQDSKASSRPKGKYKWLILSTTVVVVGILLILYSARHAEATVQVDSQKFWHPVFEVLPFDQIQVLCGNEEWTLGKGQDGWPPSDANGLNRQEPWLPIPTVNAGSLIGRIGWAGDPFPIPCNRVFTSKGRGVLLVSINDGPNRDDNDGVIPFRFTLSPLIKLD